ncbi:hypothetical protein THAOC_15547 [Thalassiosira oceanica]|uniref:Uncharacterized protein n=1 Tax=Thalassiosira oceanica TaxID=159749 RepID=K0SFL0_THAOC|nr:hypothetical protein THAOC_15547 [Thalassiosira oceanica]|eukprot:EJK63779.1 hypothetical protein THAOC_15547 [Thalassiosira oceanica]
MAFLQQLAMALSSIRGGPGADSPGSRRHGAARPARVSILPGDPPANDASVEGSPRSFGSGGMGIGLSQYVMSQQSQSSSDTSTLLSDEFLSSLSHDEFSDAVRPRAPSSIPSGKIIAAGKFVTRNGNVTSDSVGSCAPALDADASTSFDGGCSQSAPSCDEPGDGDGLRWGAESRDEPASTLASNGAYGASLTQWHLSDELCHECIDMLRANSTSPLDCQKEQLNGRPLTQYHATDDEFLSIFSELEAGATSSMGLEGRPDVGPKAFGGALVASSCCGTHPNLPPPDFAASQTEDIILLDNDILKKDSINELQGARYCPILKAWTILQGNNVLPFLKFGRLVTRRGSTVDYDTLPTLRDFVVSWRDPSQPPSVLIKSSFPGHHMYKRSYGPSGRVPPNRAGEHPINVHHNQNQYALSSKRKPNVNPSEKVQPTPVSNPYKKPRFRSRMSNTSGSNVKNPYAK